MDCIHGNHDNLRRSARIHAAYVERHYRWGECGEILFSGCCRHCHSDITMSEEAVATASPRVLALYVVRTPAPVSMFRLAREAMAAGVGR